MGVGREEACVDALFLREAAVVDEDAVDGTLEDRGGDRLKGQKRRLAAGTETPFDSIVDVEARVSKPAADADADADPSAQVWLSRRSKNGSRFRRSELKKGSE